MAIIDCFAYREAEKITEEPKYEDKETVANCHVAKRVGHQRILELFSKKQKK